MKFRITRKSRDRIEAFDSLREPKQSAPETPAKEAPAQDASPLAAPAPVQPRGSAPAVFRKSGDFSVCALTDIGMVRRTNQDCLVCEGPVAGVADGMGGHLGGETASALCRDTLLGELRGKAAGPDVLRKAVARANAVVYERSESDETVRGMGATLCVLWIGESRLYVAHVGDSRCYRFSAGTLTQVTDDHSMVMEMVRAGVLTAEAAAVHPMRNVITRAVGTDPEADADILDFPRVKGDLWLLCSDGLHGMIGDTEITAVLAGDGADADKARKLMDAALAAGGHDNISLALVRIERGEAAE